MSLFGLLGSLLSGIFSKSVVSTVVDAAKNWWNIRTERKLLQAQTNNEILKARAQAEIENIKTKQKAYADADTAAINQWQYSYLDEILVISIVILIFSCFIPGLQDYVDRGVHILNNFPFWMQLIIAGTYVSVL